MRSEGSLIQQKIMITKFYPIESSDECHMVENIILSFLLAPKETFGTSKISIQKPVPRKLCQS